jgi:hypothetical protein
VAGEAARADAALKRYAGTPELPAFIVVRQQHLDEIKAR